MKTCSRCRVDKPLDEFNRRSASPDGHGAYCRPCAAEVARRAYRSNPAPAKRRARERTEKYGLRNHSRIVRELLAERDGPTCGICGEDLDPATAELDHVVPLGRGGTHTASNLQLAHRRCNRAKRDRV